MAEVAVRLRNRGPDAYKPELYGEAIVVERKLRIDGTGWYQLKDENGTTFFLHLFTFLKIFFISNMTKAYKLQSKVQVIRNTAYGSSTQAS